MCRSVSLALSNCIILIQLEQVYETIINILKVLARCRCVALTSQSTKKPCCYFMNKLICITLRGCSPSSINLH
jgi:hypothetical protein